MTKTGGKRRRIDTTTNTTNIADGVTGSVFLMRGRSARRVGRPYEPYAQERGFSRMLNIDPIR
ncbi:MAG TPA: hypothetical protein VIV66_08290 [Pyrinomonadaceae bacterium]